METAMEAARHAAVAPTRRRRPHLPAPPSSRLALVMLAAIALVAGATVGGVVKLWPHGTTARTRGIVATKTLPAKVEEVKLTSCPVAGPASCMKATVKLLAGSDAGRTEPIAVANTTGFARLKPGDRVRVIPNGPPPSDYDGPKLGRYSFFDYDRRQPLTWLAAIFVVLLLAASRLAGLRALLGLGVSLVLVVFFVIPSILAGHSPFAVALVGSLAVLLTAIPLSYGLGPKSIAAWLGTALSLLLAVGLAAGFTHLAHLTGTDSEQAVLLASSDRSISVRGLLLAGMIIGALGVLVDLTVSQASTVLALRKANPSLRFRGLLRGALGVGNDHIAATVNTLVFAYAG